MPGGPRLMIHLGGHVAEVSHSVANWHSHKVNFKVSLRLPTTRRARRPCRPCTSVLKKSLEMRSTLSVEAWRSSPTSSPPQKVWRRGIDMIIRLFMELVIRPFSLQVAAVYLAPVADRWFCLRLGAFGRRKKYPMEYSMASVRLDSV